MHSTQLGNRINSVLRPLARKCSTKRLACVVFPARSTPSNKMKRPRDPDIYAFVIASQLIYPHLDRYAFAKPITRSSHPPSVQAMPKRATKRAPKRESQFLFPDVVHLHVAVGPLAEQLHVRHGAFLVFWVGKSDTCAQRRTYHSDRDGSTLPEHAAFG